MRDLRDGEGVVGCGGGVDAEGVVALEEGASFEAGVVPATDAAIGSVVGFLVAFNRFG